MQISRMAAYFISSNGTYIQFFLHDIYLLHIFAASIGAFVLSVLHTVLLYNLTI